MLRGAKGWLLSRGAAVVALGFLLSLIGALGSAFYLDPAQKSEGAAAQQIALESVAGANASGRHVLRRPRRSIWAVSCSPFRCRAT